MKISCQSCGAKYNIADEKVRGKIVKIACKKCGARIEIDGREPEAQAQDQDETRVFDQAAAPAGAPAADTWTASIDDNDQREVTTAQLLDLYRQGVVTLDTFVWRDGMPDWAAVRDVPALQQALAASGPSAPPPAYSEPPTAVHPAAQYDPHQHAAAAASPFNGGGAGVSMAAGGGYGTPQIEASQPARLGGSRRGGAVDLFAPGSAGEDDDVATSAPSGAALGAMAAAPVGEQKPIGARNENSVLFSLSALTASGPAPAQASAGVREEEKSGLIDIQKLAQSAKTNGAKGDDRAKLDDIMNLGGGGAFGSALGAPILAPPPAAALTESPAEAEAKKSNKGLIIGLGAGVAALLVALIVVIVVMSGKKDETTAAKDKEKSELETPKAKDKDKDKGSAGTSETAAAAPTETAPDPGSTGPIGKPGTKPPAGGTTTAKADPGAKDPKAAGTASAAPPPAGGTGEKKCKTLDECIGGGGAPPPPPKKEDPAPSGGGEPDKAAVKSALGSVPYKDCGSGGGGKVTVTFGPNGNVTSAVVTAGDYDGGTKACIQKRFSSAKIPAYGGAPKSFAWGISL